ncbi:hypothetical protein [Actinomadura rudentiformis]|uniref:Uncharacterized protein n=1 Tax=Actinomadura rudentiformis TaxID=359158 RepID=A0A6H9Y9S0_9ACTN|nr:hypothetical protein [Actinomadura rudentiformis]KAB2341888.1 hypothetical protein F8566_40645 [Actinomadura rudentiformis]
MEARVVTPPFNVVDPVLGQIELEDLLRALCSAGLQILRGSGQQQSARSDAVTLPDRLRESRRLGSQVPRT